MSYRLIRCSLEYGFVIAVTPADAGPTDAIASYYRCADWRIGDQEADRFHEVSRDEALSYFSGQAAHMGFGIPPDREFATLDDALAWRKVERVSGMPAPRFFELLRSAYLASEAVDSFDLRSDDPENVVEFNQLCLEQLTTARALVEHCKAHGEHVIEILGKLEN